MTTNKDQISALYNEMTCLCEIRGELSAEDNAKVEQKISELQKEIDSLENLELQKNNSLLEDDQMTENHFVLYINGYNVSHSLSVMLVKQTEKAMQFRVLGGNKDYFLWFPKSALKVDKNVASVLVIQNWFTVSDFMRWCFDTFGDHHNRGWRSRR